MQSPSLVAVKVYLKPNDNENVVKSGRQRETLLTVQEHQLGIVTAATTRAPVPR